ncbi:hypothetical protein [Chitinimonas sp.]|uniref:hypothetical protein n=1 Tax=Chitinimonas sp. TaxID=1934313 RepID=UPI002F93E005
MPAYRLLRYLPSLLALPVLAGPEVRCHVDYGGERWEISAQPSTTPYTIAPTAIGSYFLFRPVFEVQPSDQAAIKLYVYADRDEGAVPIQQANYPYPAHRARGPYGFTGLQTVYEPVRDGELQYWCELATTQKRSKP